MNTTPIATASPNKISSNKLQLQTQDFINMMVTQLQNQDPLEPAKNEQLLAQMSQIGQLQASTNLQQSLQSMVMQNQIASAGNLIGKMVSGPVQDDGSRLSGLVTSVNVEGDQVFLELDNGRAIRLDQVTYISSAPTQTATL